MSAMIHFVTPSEVHSAREGLLARGLDLASLDGAAISDKDSLLAALGRALAFPAYYGGNWDAAEECLADLAERPSQGYGLIVARAGDLWQHLPREMGMLVSIWLGAGRRLARRDIHLELVFVLEE
jgi:RNAse (barnase) inhibitor barstar